MKALVTYPQAGYPTDYLLSRVRGRRTALVTDWPALLAAGTPPVETEEAIRQSLQAEFVWLFRQMNQPLRRLFAPVFLTFELRTVAQCLRHQEREPQMNERLLARSLLAAELQRALRRPGDLAQAVATVAAAFTPPGTARGELEKAYAADGLPAFEIALAGVWFERALRESRHPHIRRFLQRLIDLRNVLLLGKHLRWELTQPPRFLDGGALPLRRLGQAWQQRRPQLLFPAHFAGSATPTTAEAEAALLGTISEELRRASRQPEAVGLLLDYIWRRRLEAMNLRLLLLGGSLEHDMLATELFR